MKYVKVVNVIRREVECRICYGRFVVPEGKSLAAAKCPNGCSDEALRVGAVLNTGNVSRTEALRWRRERGELVE